MGWIYILHFKTPYKHARHYCGWTGVGVTERVSRHLKGQGSRLMQVVTEAGIETEIAQVYPNKSRVDERRLKDRRCTPALCPICNPRVKRTRSASIIRGRVRRGAK